MRDLAGLQSKQNGDAPRKRLIILGAILFCVFIVWAVTMIAG
ncbi:MAG TPA: hypothetical protein VKS20_08330 [Candidatus Acidoferrales bacterium]|nr:hypothetical protein [Candidatus Acidoferrales bacterium]